MEVIAHRGFWQNPEEKNSYISFERAFKSGFGVETDFRDFNGELVISHNIAVGGEVSAEDFFKLYQKLDSTSCLALNIKADGLQEKLKELIEKYNVQNYFCFDMSIPDTIGYVNNGLKIATRHSEYEKEFPFYDDSEFVWMDCFKSDWFGAKEIEEHLNNGKKVCIVSPDLHKREYKAAWAAYKDIKSDNLLICTDYPTEAKEFLND